MTSRQAFAHAMWAVSTLVVLTFLFAPGARTADDIQIATGVTVPARAVAPDSEPATPSLAALDVVEVPATPVAPSARRLDRIPGTTLPVPNLAGDCDAWADVFRAYGATNDEVAFFVPRIIERESGCGRDTLNDRTGDTGVCQLSPVHNRSGYFGGEHYGPGGWLLELHGLTTRVDTDNPSWASACLTLLRVCGTGPWRPPYSCANNQLNRGE